MIPFVLPGSTLGSLRPVDSMNSALHIGVDSFGGDFLNAIAINKARDMNEYLLADSSPAYRCVQCQALYIPGTPIG